MTYQEAINKSLTLKWKVGTCLQGEECWCRIITCDPPLMYEEVGVEEEFYVVGSGQIMKEVAEHIVNIQNETYGGNK
jgi:hypothetical protein